MPRPAKRAQVDGYYQMSYFGNRKDTPMSIFKALKSWLQLTAIRLLWPFLSEETKDYIDSKAREYASK
jgi:hypothetical protein